MRRVFYHGGVGDLPIGGFILPPRATGYLYGDRDDRVYVTTDLMQAINYALIMRGMIYRVQPIGRLGVAGPDDYTAHRALVLAREAVPPRLAKFQYADFHRFHRDYVDLELALRSEPGAACSAGPGLRFAGMPLCGGPARKRSPASA